MPNKIAQAVRLGNNHTPSNLSTALLERRPDAEAVERARRSLGAELADRVT